MNQASHDRESGGLDFSPPGAIISFTRARLAKALCMHRLPKVVKYWRLANFLRPEPTVIPSQVRVVICKCRQPSCSKRSSCSAPDFTWPRLLCSSSSNTGSTSGEHTSVLPLGSVLWHFENRGVLGLKAIKTHDEAHDEAYSTRLDSNSRGNRPNRVNRHPFELGL